MRSIQVDHTIQTGKNDRTFVYGTLSAKGRRYKENIAGKLRQDLAGEIGVL